MIGLWLLSKGLMAGLAIAVPVGPVNVLCASRTLSKGRLSGLMSGFGAATADAFYGAIAGFSITLVIEFLEREEFWIRVIGGLLLVAIGVVYFRKPAHALNLENKEGATHSDYTSSLLLTLTNPDHSTFVCGGAGRAGDGRAPAMVADIPGGGRNILRVDALVGNSGAAGRPVPR